MAITERDAGAGNYLGELFLVGANQTPFLNMMGGLGGSRSKITRSMIYPMAQPWALGAATIPAVTEDALVAAATASTTFARGQDTNTVMIFKKDVIVSYLKTAAYGELSGLSALGDQPVTDEMAFQKMATLKQIAIDAELAFLTGTYAAAANGGVAAQTKGIITGCTTNTVAAGGAKVTKVMIDAVLLEMATNGAQFENMKLFCNGFNKGVITDAYGYVPEDRNLGGSNIMNIETNFAKLEVIYAPHVPADTILIADMNFVYPVFLPFRGQTLFYEDLAKTSGAERGQFIAFAGIDFGCEEYHSTITGTAIV